jgi:hypothetical protein
MRPAFRADPNQVRISKNVPLHCFVQFRAGRAGFKVELGVQGVQAKTMANLVGYFLEEDVAFGLDDVVGIKTQFAPGVLSLKSPGRPG